MVSTPGVIADRQLVVDHFGEQVSELEVAVADFGLVGDAVVFRHANDLDVAREQAEPRAP